MSLHNLATVFGPTLLRPSEKDSKIPANPTQAINMGDSWSLEVMAQVKFAPPAFLVAHTVSMMSAHSAQVQVLLYFLQLETIPTPDSKRQSILFSTEVQIYSGMVDATPGSSCLSTPNVMCWIPDASSFAGHCPEIRTNTSVLVLQQMWFCLRLNIPFSPVKENSPPSL